MKNKIESPEYFNRLIHNAFHKLSEELREAVSFEMLFEIEEPNFVS